MPKRISMTLTIDSMRKTQPMTDPTAEPIIPNRRTLRLMWALKASSTSLLLSKLMASLSPCATSDEKRKKLNDTTSNTSSFFATSIPASHARFSRLCWPGVVRESPTKTAMVKSEFTFTRPSRAVTCTLVVDDDDDGIDVTLPLSR
ncbi:hypothetical protein PanWU01x14_044860 [Parasponia andersonii]|uniref:Uncharacterized protein n=1 Tax=Parasponia andersonii TaxID=3476 RepID=A0A2P5DPC8_PARAD|nr:hypothetical protein PanWU01x14_044860 [Parasponia andersonii]